MYLSSVPRLLRIITLIDVRYSLMNSRQLLRAEPLGNRGETAHVGEQHGQLAAFGLHAVLLRIRGHLVDQLRRHVLAEQLGELALGARFDEVAVGHVDGVEQRRSSAPTRRAAAPCSRRVQTMTLSRTISTRPTTAAPAVAHSGRQHRHQQRQRHAADQQQHHLGAEHVGRLLLDACCRACRRSGWRGSRPRDRRCPPASSAGRAGPARWCRRARSCRVSSLGRDAVEQHVGERDVVEAALRCRGTESARSRSRRPGW